MRTLSLPGVYRPDVDSQLLVGAVETEDVSWSTAAALDLCTGSGIVAVAAALQGAAEVTAVDCSRRAVLTTRLNAALNGVHVEALHGDLLSCVGDRRFDVITCNPPYVPAETDELPTRGRFRAFDGGVDGRLVLDRVLEGAPRHLRPGGVLLIAQSSLCGVEPTLEAFAAHGLEAEVVTKQREPLGPVMSARAELFEAQGLLAPGERVEELVVLRGRRPTSRRFARRGDRTTAADTVTA